MNPCGIHLNGPDVDLPKKLFEASSRIRPVLLIDEAQEMTPQALSELRLLSSARFDSQPLLCIVLAGDARLIEKLRREELIPLGSRIRTRLATEFASREELLACLVHLLAGAGNASLMTAQLRQTLCDHAVGNYRVLTTLAAELLAAGAQEVAIQLFEARYGHQTDRYYEGLCKDHTIPANIESR